MDERVKKIYKSILYEGISGMMGEELYWSMLDALKEMPIIRTAEINYRVKKNYHGCHQLV